METPAHLIVDIARLDKEGESFEGETGDVLDLGPKAFMSSLGGIHYSLYVQVFGTELLARGSIEQDISAICSRCAHEFTFTAEVKDFAVSIEITEKTEYVDLTEELRQSIILALPTYPVCRQDCRGLCSVCGKDLNDGPCQCKKDVLDTRWAALDAVKPISKNTGEKKHR